jgi:hypothetical protein
MINGKPLRDQKFKGTPWQSLVLEGLPRQLIQDCKRKAREQGSTLKEKIITMMTAWCYAEDNVVFEDEDEF